LLAYHTPGIYKTAPVTPPPPLTLARTDIAGFVGYAERGPLPEDFQEGFDASLVARRLTSWAEYQTVYGSFLKNGYLPYAVRGFFETGGDTCYVVRIAATRPTVDPGKQARAASFPLPSGPAQPVGVLAGPGGAFTVNITLTPPLTPAALIGTQIAFSHAGLIQNRTVLDVLPDNSVLLSSPLDPNFVQGDPVAQYPVAAVITARSRGAWGNRIQLRFTALDGEPGAFALTVAFFPEGSTVPTEQEFYRELVTDPAKPNDAAVTLASQSNLITWTGTAKISFNALSDRVLYLSGGRDGVADVTLEDFTGSVSDRRGLKLLEEIDEVGILSVPDAVLTITSPLKAPPIVSDSCSPPPAPPPPVLPPDPTSIPAMLSGADCSTLQMLMIEQCERLNFRFALIDPPKGLQPADKEWASLLQGLTNHSSRFAALYYPWLTIPDPLAGPAGTRDLPPSGYVAGAYAQTDLSAGVWKPPANVALPSVADVAEKISDLLQGPLNDANVNAIRAFPGRGIRIWGARSLAAAADDAWRFVHIRRLMSAIEKTILLSSRWAVFEVNNKALRKALTHSLTVLLETIWKNGGLKGNRPDEGFYVKCDDTNNPQSIIDVGQVVCQVGVAVAAPMEFLIFQIRQTVTGGTVVES
jgi:hypothetical protein